MNPTAILCQTGKTASSTAVEMASIDEELRLPAEGYLRVESLVPRFLASAPVCGDKGVYLLVPAAGGEIEPICTFHDRARAAPLIMAAYLELLLGYRGWEFVMGAQGRRTGLSDLAAMVREEGFEKGWKAYQGGNALDCSSLAIESMRDALARFYREPSLLPDTGARGLGQIDPGYAYTEAVTTSVCPTALVDPETELRPGDMAIVKYPKGTAHTTIYLGPCFRSRGDETRYWIWASLGKGKVEVFTHEEFKRAFNALSPLTVARWKLDAWVP